MAIYSIAISPLLDIMIATAGNNSKMAAFTDDMSAAGKVISLKDCWNRLIEVGPIYGYYPQSTKSWLIVKPYRQIHRQCCRKMGGHLTKEYSLT